MKTARAPKKKKQKLTAANADKFALYETSVQDPPTDVAFIDRVFRANKKPKPMTVREDFCGTAKFCATWVSSDEGRLAYGLDLHKPTLKYGQKTHIDPLGDAAARVSLRREDVMSGISEKVEATVAFNFSYWIFKKRSELLQYFRAVRRGLRKGGAFFLDIYGGPEAQIEVEEETKQKGFTYVWDQEPLNAITNEAVRHIHFRFKDGTEIRRAFTYDWRIWSLPEVCDILREAGFGHVDVYWEGTDEDGDGDGNFRLRRKAENEESWIAYVVGWNET